MPWISDDLAAIAGVLLQDLGEFVGRRKVQRHDDAVVADARGGVRAGRRGRRGNHAVQRAGLQQRGAVLNQQRLQQRQQLRSCNGMRRVQGHHAMHGRIDRIIHAKDGAQDLRHHLAQIGVREVERDVAAGIPCACRRKTRHARHAERDLHRRRGVRRTDRTVHTRPRNSQIIRRTGQRRDLGTLLMLAGSKREREQQRQRDVSDRHATVSVPATGRSRDACCRVAPRACVHRSSRKSRY